MKLLVCAGNYNEHAALCKYRRWDPTEVQYLTVEKLKCTLHQPVLFHGTWWERSDLAQIYELIRANHAVVLGAEQTLLGEN